MVDKTARAELATRLRQLVDGELTNDEFDAAYYGRWENSADKAVAEIAAFGYGLYSSDLLMPYRLKGRYALADEERQAAQHALMFLATELEYEWPTNVKGVVPYWSLWGPGCYLVAGLILIFTAWMGHGPWDLLPLAIGVMATAWTFHWLFTYRSRFDQLQRFYRSGEHHVWPFLRQTDIAEASGRSTPEVRSRVT